MDNAHYGHTTAILNDSQLQITSGTELSFKLISSEIFDPIILIQKTVGLLNIAQFQNIDFNINTHGNFYLMDKVKCKLGTKNASIFLKREQ